MGQGSKAGVPIVVQTPSAGEAAGSAQPVPRVPGLRQPDFRNSGAGRLQLRVRN